MFWLVDPLDGTKEFINRNDEFTVNIALVEDGVPTLGVVLAPALDRLFAGVAGSGAYVEDAAGRRPIRCRAVPEEGLTVVASRSHGDVDALNAYLGARKVASIRGAGSSLKLCVRGRRRGRPVSAARPDDGMGHRRRPRRAQRRRRQRCRSVGRSAHATASPASRTRTSWRAAWPTDAGERPAPASAGFCRPHRANSTATYTFVPSRPNDSTGH